MGCILKLVSFLLFFNIFYIQGIRRPYVLLSKAKEELNEYAYELDRLVDKRTYELRQVNKRLMADLEVARGIQQAMLPEVLPQNEFVSFVSGYLPAENLSGDFYNVIKIDESHYGVYIGDVSGHGVSAAMLTVFTFQKIMSLVDEIGKEGMTIPAMVLKHLYNSFNAANFSEELYIVLIYGVYNIDTGIFSYASGGLNTSPLRLRPDGSIQELETEGFAICKLGDLITPKFSNRQVMLFPGDKLIIYTDGLVEAVNPEKQPYSKERLKDLISKHRKWNASRMTEIILEDVKQYSEHIKDDVTILTIDVLRPF
jgi:sigma-B regulation protein RsbU (phosphoserine phosphatase)